jgi:hypothetical protein
VPRPALALGLVRVDLLHDRVELVEPGECRGAIDRIVRERALGAVAVRWATTWSASPRGLGQKRPSRTILISTKRSPCSSAAPEERLALSEPAGARVTCLEERRGGCASALRLVPVDHRCEKPKVKPCPERID